MPETEARTPGPKIATVERREASASGGTRPRLASADLSLRLAALHPPRLAEGDGNEGTNPGAATRRGNEETALFDIVNRKKRQPGCDAHRGREAFTTAEPV